MTESTYRRYDTAAEKLPEHVRKRLERDLPRRVLVVDEDGSCRQLIREFTEHQWEVLEASTVEEAQTMMSTLEPVADTPPPLGYDLGMLWKNIEDPTFGLLRWRPWRISTGSLGEVMAGKPDIVCHL